jgi:hypothetical protein
MSATGLARIKFRVKGDCPLILHNKRLANYRDPYAKQLKLYTAKRKKTDEEMEKISEIEFYGGLYMSPDGYPIIPAVNMEASIMRAASRQKLMAAFKRAARVEKDIQLEYDGPKTADGLWKEDRFVFITDVVVSGRTMRTRPIFPEWEGEFTVAYLPEEINRASIVKAVEDAGVFIGTCEWRPKYGRFSVVDVQDVKS